MRFFFIVFIGILAIVAPHAKAQADPRRLAPNMGNAQCRTQPGCQGTDLGNFGSNSACAAAGGKSRKGAGSGAPCTTFDTCWSEKDCLGTELAIGVSQEECSSDAMSWLNNANFPNSQCTNFMNGGGINDPHFKTWR